MLPRMWRRTSLAGALPYRMQSSPRQVTPSRAAKKKTHQAKLRLGQDDMQGPAVMVRGIKQVDQVFVLTMAAYNLTRMRSLGEISLQAM